MAVTRKKSEKKACSSCNRNLVITQNYYSINGTDPAFADNLYPVCKDCCKKLVNDELAGHKTFLKILMVLNRPFIQEIFEECNFDRGLYLTTITNRMKKVSGEFLDSEDLFNGKVMSINEDTIESLTPEELRDCQLFWGVGNYTEDDYLFLMAMYEKYLNTYDVDSPTMESNIAQICQLDLDIKKKRAAGIDTTKETKLQLEVMRSAGIAPSQEKANKTNEQQSFGMWVRIWENEQPVPEPLPMFADVDGIRKAIREDFLYPMLKSLDMENPNESEYLDYQEQYGISKEDLLGIEGDE